MSNHLQRFLKTLIGKLNAASKEGLNEATNLCASRTNYSMEMEHWLYVLAGRQGNDLEVIFRQFGVDAGRLQKDLNVVLDKLRTGNDRTPSFSPDIFEMIREGWVRASLDYQGGAIRTGHLLVALLNSEKLGYKARQASKELEKIPPEQLLNELPTLLQYSKEQGGEAGTGAVSGAAGGAARPGAAGGPGAPAGGGGKTEFLDQFCIDLTAQAKANKIDPVLGRDAEIRQLVDILTRRRQNNPILTGEAGVGKTAVVEGFARRIAIDDVPPSLRGIRLMSLDLGLLEAGASVKGEFEKRLKGVIDEVKASTTPIIMFIDEAHTLIGAGGTAGQNDAANLLKPALARGELRTIAATTWAEYKKYFEQDAALTRRFQVVKVEEPSEPVCVEMMRGLVSTLENHHNVRVLNSAVVDAVKLSHRYIHGRQLPDKAVSLLDTACARVGISQSAIPAQIEDLRRRLEQNEVARDILMRETATGSDHSEDLEELSTGKTDAEEKLKALEERWEKEKELVEKIRDIRGQLEPPAKAKTNGKAPASPLTAEAGQGAAPGEAQQFSSAPSATVEATGPLDDATREKLLNDLKALNAELEGIQGEEPLIQVCVDQQAIAEVVSNWTGIPVGRMVSDEIRTVMALKDHMEERIVGQSHALEAIAQRIRTARAGLTDPRRPIGVFLLVGTSGTGKTETAITLAELLYGGEQNMTVINMSEYKEEHRVSTLVGAPKGYVGYGEGGVLTEAVRRRPYSVVLLDEMEKAHPGVQDLFFQVFDKGSLRDDQGRDIDFKNTLIIMTSNAATEMVMKLAGPDADPETMPDSLGLQEAIYPELLKFFKPAFLGRLTVIPYFPLSDEVMKKIIVLQLGRIERRVRENYKAKLTYDPALIETIAGRCKEVESGARNVDHILTRSLLPEMSEYFLARMADDLPITKVHIGVNDEGQFTYELD
jgi:type VI secretion system protein VasG